MAENKDSEIYYSVHRNIPLLYVGKSQVLPIITLENCSKWYGVEIIHPNGVVDHIQPDVLNHVAKMYPDAPYGDHNFHPHFLYHLADFLQAKVDERAIEVAGARWLYEQEGSEDFFHPSKLEPITINNEKSLQNVSDYLEGFTCDEEESYNNGDKIL